MCKWQGSKWIRPQRRRAIYSRDGFRCRYCGCDVLPANDPDRKRLHRAEATLDHKKHRSRGGDNSNRNLVTACRGCNSSRQANKRPRVRPENRALSYGMLAPGASPGVYSSAGRPNKKSVDSVVKQPHKGRTGRKAPSARTGPLASSSGRSYVRYPTKVKDGDLLLLFWKRLAK